MSKTRQTPDDVTGVEAHARNEAGEWKAILFTSIGTAKKSKER